VDTFNMLFGNFILICFVFVLLREQLRH